jgi:hypothetical protein
VESGHGDDWKPRAHDYVLLASSDVIVVRMMRKGSRPLQLSVDVVRDATADYPLQALSPYRMHWAD